MHVQLRNEVNLEVNYLVLTLNSNVLNATVEIRNRK